MRLSAGEIWTALVGASPSCGRGLAAAVRSGLLPRAGAQHRSLCRALHGLDAVFRSDALRLAGDGGILRPRHLCGGARPRSSAVSGAGSGRAALRPRVLAGLVGAATLRISGVYFVIFTFGLAELVRQVVSYAQIKLSTRMGLYVFTDFTEKHIYWMLLALTVARLHHRLADQSLAASALPCRSSATTRRWRAIPASTPRRLKIILFMISGAFIGMAGAILAPRYAYVEPPSAFNPMISFLVVIMALLGGTRRLWGPLVGVIPFTHRDGFRVGALSERHVHRHRHRLPGHRLSAAGRDYGTA